MKAVLLVCCCSIILFFGMACAAELSDPIVSQASPVATSTVAKASPTPETSPTLSATIPPSPSLSPFASRTRSPTVTQTTRPTSTAIPTLDNIEREARALQKARIGTSCEGLYYQCLGPYAIRVLDFLYQHPTSPYREVLVERLVNTLGYKHAPFSIKWLVQEWMDEVVSQPFDAAGGLPAGFVDEWQRGEILTTDLDDNGEPDYLIMIRLNDSSADAAPSDGLYWVHQREDRYQLELIQARTHQMWMEVKATQDLNGDGHTDLAYSMTTCGASDCFEHLRLLTWQDGTWQPLPLTSYAPFYEWTPQNGGWSIQDNADGPVTLIGSDGGPGSAGFAPGVAFQLRFELRNGEFTPVSIELAQERSEDITWQQWAQKLIRAHYFSEALEVLTMLLNKEPSRGSPIDYKPYTLYRLGITHLLMGNVEATRQAWQEVTIEYPEHPISRDIPKLNELAQEPQHIWRVCAWLRENDPDWKTSEISENDILWLGPFVYRTPLNWDYGCHPLLLVTLATWTRSAPLATQASQFGFEWQLLDDSYDLNTDGIADPIGTLNGLPWLFLSTQNNYQPLYAVQPFPLGAVELPYRYDHYIRREYKIQLTDLDGNQQPEILLIYPSGFTLSEWIGHRFYLHFVQYKGEQSVLKGDTVVQKNNIRVELSDDHAPTDQVEPLVWTYQLADRTLSRISPTEKDEKSLLSEAVEALYRQRDPQRTLDILENFSSTDSWKQGAANYLQALALEYTGEKASARIILANIRREFADTVWAPLAEERLRKEK